MRHHACVIAIVLLIVGCGYFDDSDDMANPVIDSAPVVIPTDADWELLATLQCNPLRPAEFYIFDWQAEAINQAYSGRTTFHL